MLLGFKTELKLNNAQRSRMAQCAGVRRFAWNWGLGITKQILDHNQANPESKIKFPSGYDLEKWFTQMVKPEYPWLNKASSFIPVKALHAVRDSWERCFKKIGKPPRFKKKGRCQDSFTIRGRNGIHIEHTRIKVPKLGWLKTYERLPQGLSVDSVTISRQSDKWFISFRLEIEPKQTEKTNLSVGVDLGVKHFATLSNGEVFDAPVEYKQIKAKIAKLQYLNRNKQRGSSNWRKAMNRIAQLHYRLTCIRKDFLHKLTTYLAKNYQVICIEDLNVSGMLKFGKLAGAVAMLGFYEFRRQLAYKCPLYGSELRVIGRWEPSSKLHHKCGYKNDGLTLKDRVFYCPECNESIDRDLNASLNIECFGLALSS